MDLHGNTKIRIQNPAFLLWQRSNAIVNPLICQISCMSPYRSIRVFELTRVSHKTNGIAEKARFHLIRSVC